MGSWADDNAQASRNATTAVVVASRLWKEGESAKSTEESCP